MTFPDIRFRSDLRPSQQEVVETARRQLEQGEHRLHVVAPPGSGKTVVGLYLWAVVIRQPAVVLSPNSAIQSQWASRVELFEVEGGADNLKPRHQYRSGCARIAHIADVPVGHSPPAG